MRAPTSASLLLYIELAKLLKKDTQCPALAKSVRLEDADQVYLVPID
jgi:hypothetical protein